MEYLGIVALLMVLVPILEIRSLRKRCSALEQESEAIFARLQAQEPS